MRTAVRTLGAVVDPHAVLALGQQAARVLGVRQHDGELRVLEEDVEVLQLLVQPPAEGPHAAQTRRHDTWRREGRA